ncbi:two-component system activity regulator YycH [Lentilactobacillus farraginis]|uniref:two-component system activity regulator YycH n=1 Tax=Lentilactobacillus farraginis TaxID=390841 RepID=UPI0034E1E35C
MHTDSNGNQTILVNRLVNSVSEIQKTMHDYKNVHLKKLSTKSQDKYFQIANRPNSIMLSYVSPVSVRIISNITNKQFKKLPNHQITRIVLPTNKSNSIYLLNDKNFAVYQVQVKQHSLKRLNNVLNMNIRRVPAALQLFNGQPMVYVKAQVPMQPYKYLIDRQSEDYYVSRLLNNRDSQGNINVKRRRNLVTYSDQNTLQLTFNSRTRIGTFSDFRNNKDQQSVTPVLDDSYNQLVDLGLPLDNVHFFNYDTDSRTVSYRTFVEGFPIFRTNSFGTISTQILNANAKRLQFSLDNPEVPIPSKQGYTNLPDTETAIRRLVARGYHEKEIKDLQIGYGWQRDKSSQLLINLVPDWYVNYKGSWRSYSSLINRY